MTYDVLVEQEQEQTYTATLLGGPRLSVSAATREEAVGKLRYTLERRLAKAEVVTIEVDLPSKPNPPHRRRACSESRRCSALGT